MQYCFVQTSSLVSVVGLSHPSNTRCLRTYLSLLQRKVTGSSPVRGISFCFSCSYPCSFLFLFWICCATKKVNMIQRAQRQDRKAQTTSCIGKQYRFRVVSKRSRKSIAPISQSDEKLCEPKQGPPIVMRGGVGRLMTDCLHRRCFACGALLRLFASAALFAHVRMFNTPPEPINTCLVKIYSKWDPDTLQGSHSRPSKTEMAHDPIARCMNLSASAHPSHLSLGWLPCDVSISGCRLVVTQCAPVRLAIKTTTTTTGLDLRFTLSILLLACS